jgi:hypothetical protein
MRYVYIATALLIIAMPSVPSLAAEPTMVEMFETFCLKTQAARDAVATLAKDLPDDWQPVKLGTPDAGSPYLKNNMWAKISAPPGGADPQGLGRPFGLSSSILITTDAEVCGVAGELPPSFSLSSLGIPGLLVSDQATRGGGSVGGSFAIEGEHFFILKTAQPTFTALELYHQTGCPDAAVLAEGKWGAMFRCDAPTP